MGLGVIAVLSGNLAGLWLLGMVSREQLIRYVCACSGARRVTLQGQLAPDGVSRWRQKNNSTGSLTPVPRLSLAGERA
jgi:hypothetical protein